MFSGITGWLLLSHTTWSEQCSHFVIHILKLLHVIGHMLHLMIIIYHHSYGTTLHLSLPTICSGIAHLYWCHKQWSLSTIIVPANIYFNIPGCYYFSSIFAHRSEVYRSAENSAVGLDALHCEQCSSFVNNSSVFIDSWCFHRLKLVKHYPSSTYIPDLRSSFCCMAICALHCAVIASSFALHRCNARRSATTSRHISTFVRLHSCLLVICLL